MQGPASCAERGADRGAAAAPTAGPAEFARGVDRGADRGVREADRGADRGVRGEASSRRRGETSIRSAAAAAGVGVVGQLEEAVECKGDADGGGWRALVGVGGARRGDESEEEHAGRSDEEVEARGSARVAGTNERRSGEPPTASPPN